MWSQGGEENWNGSLTYGLMRAQSLSCVQLFATLWTVALQASLSMRILQARILEWVAMPSSRGPLQPRDWTLMSYVSCNGRRILYHYHNLGSPSLIIGSNTKITVRKIRNWILKELRIRRQPKCSLVWWLNGNIFNISSGRKLQSINQCKV